MSKSKRLPTWKEMYTRWQLHGVEPVEVIKFDRNVHYNSEPWVCRAEGKQWRRVICTNPQRTTAYHITKGIVTQSSKAFAAFAINAYLLERGNYHHMHRDIAQEMRITAMRAIEAIDPRPGSYWTSNSRIVLPYLTENICGVPTEDVGDWRQIVDCAATFWKQARDTLAVVRIPDFMDFQSDELRDWYDHCKQMSEQQERHLYESLKAKYESGNSPTGSSSVG